MVHTKFNIWSHNCWALNRKRMLNVKIYQRMLLKQMNIRMLEHSFMLYYVHTLSVDE